MVNRKELSKELKQTTVNLALKCYCLPKIGQLVNKTHSTVQCIVNKFKYTGYIKNKARKPKGKHSVLEKKGKIRKNPRLSAPKLRGIVENTTRKTMCNQTICREIGRAHV